MKKREPLRIGEKYTKHHLTSVFWVTGDILNSMSPDCGRMYWKFSSVFPDLSKSRHLINQFESLKFSAFSQNQISENPTLSVIDWYETYVY